MSEETNDGTWSGLKKTIIGTLSTVVAGGGTWLGVTLFGGHSEEPKEETKTETAAPAPVAVPAAPQTPSQMKWEKETHEFGTIEQGKPVSYEFTFTNTTNKDVTLKDKKGFLFFKSTNV